MSTAAFGHDTIASAVAFRPRHPCAFYENAGTAGSEHMPNFDRHWQAALAWLRFMPWLAIAEAERAAGAREHCLHGAMRSRPCLRLQVRRLRAT